MRVFNVDKYTLACEELEIQDKALDKIGDKLDNCFRRLMENVIVDNGYNTVFSPLVLFRSLVNLYAIADGEAKRELLDVLGIDKKQLEVLNGLVNKALLAENTNAICEIGSSLWLNRDIINEKILEENLVRKYNPEIHLESMGTAEADKQIGKWIADKTRGLVSTGIKTHKDECLKLLSTIYCKASWYNSFYEKLTRRGKFWVTPDKYVECKFMKDMYKGVIHEYVNFSAIILYMHDGYRTVLALPKNCSAASLYKDAEFMKFITEREDYSKNYCFVNLKLPKLDLENETNLLPVLKKMKIVSITSPGKKNFCITDCDELYLSAAEQKTRLVVNEEGIEGASCVELGIACAGAPAKLEERDFYIDRPFAFVISRGIQLPIFAGVVNNPNMKNITE